MYRNLRWKLVVILALVICTSAFAWVQPLAERLRVPLPGFMAERRLSLGLDLKGGVQFILRVNAQEALGIDASLTRDDVVAQAREAVDRRINALGVLEPVIAVQGEERDEILIQLPGFTDVERARAILGQIARLEWRLVEDGVPGPAAISGRDVRRARVTRDDFGLPAVGFSLTPDGTRRFAELTSANHLPSSLTTRFSPLRSSRVPSPAARASSAAASQWKKRQTSRCCCRPAPCRFR
jgi:preprotein translocase subunit SecD